MITLCHAAVTNTTHLHYRMLAFLCLPTKLLDYWGQTHMHRCVGPDWRAVPLVVEEQLTSPLQAPPLRRVYLVSDHLLRGIADMFRLPAALASISHLLQS